MPEPTDPAGKKVLIVDDDDSARDLLYFIAKRQGFAVEVVADGKAGLASIHQARPDLIILDLMLPGTGGFEILRQLQGGEAADVPIIVITGRNADRTLNDMIKGEPNVKDFMSKPLQAADLAASMHGILGTTPPASRKDVRG